MPLRFPRARQGSKGGNESPRRTQQETLSRMCVKPYEGDAVKFLKELMILRDEDRED